MMYRLSGLLLALSMGLIGWIAFEMGLLSYTPAGAAEKEEPAAYEALQKNLEEKLKAADAKEAALNRKAAELEEREKAMSSQMKEMEKRVRESEKRPAQSNHAKDGRLESVGAVYERMEPKKSAKILEQMDLSLASQIVALMKRDRAAEVLGNIGSERARMITEQMLIQRGILSTSSVNEVGGSNTQK